MIVHRRAVGQADVDLSRLEDDVEGVFADGADGMVDFEGFADLLAGGGRYPEALAQEL